MTKNAVIVGAGKGLSAAFARRLFSDGYKIALAARDIEKLSTVVSDTNAICKTCDCSNPHSIAGLFEWLDNELNI